MWVVFHPRFRMQNELDQEEAWFNAAFSILGTMRFRASGQKLSARYYLPGVLDQGVFRATRWKITRKSLTLHYIRNKKKIVEAVLGVVVSAVDPLSASTDTRVVHGSDGPASWVGSRFCRILAGRVSTSFFYSFLLIIFGSWIDLLILYSDWLFFNDI